MDLADGEYLRTHFERRSWEWIDQMHFVCRERSLATDQVRLISREVVVHAEKGVIADHAAILPGVERVGDRTVRFVHDDPETAYRGFLALVRLVEPVSG